MARANLNFFWVSDEPKEKHIKRLKVGQIENLTNWAQSTQDSEFRVNLYVDDATLDELKQREKVVPIHQEEEAETYFFSTGNFFVLSITPLLQRYSSLYPSLIEFYHTNIDFKNYAFASDVARLLIQNDSHGFYIDMDITPNQSAPLTLESMITDLSVSGYQPETTPYYLNIIKSLDLDGTEKFTVENQIILSLKKNSLDQILQSIESRLCTDEGESNLQKELEEHENYKKLARVSQLNTSFFQKHPDFQYLAAFHSKNRRRFLQLNHKEINGDDPSNTLNITRKYHWLSIPYKGLSDPFVKQLLLEDSHLKSYTTGYPHILGRYFNSKQDSLRLYRWANPGYARLSDLEKAVAFIERRYLDSHQKPRQNKTFVTALSVNKFMKEIIKKIYHIADQKETHELKKYQKKFFKTYQTKLYLSTTEEKEFLREFTTLLLALQKTAWHQNICQLFLDEGYNNKVLEEIFDRHHEFLQAIFNEPTNTAYSDEVTQTPSPNSNGSK